MAQPRRVVLSTDIGTEMDDQWALAQLALSPEIDLRCVVSAHAPNLAPPAAETSAVAARDLLSRLNRTRVPEVIAGSSEPLISGHEPRMNAGVERILAEIHAAPPDSPLTMLVIGAATDMASALLVEPSIAQKIEVVAMGFLDWPEGGNEWNVHNDVAAWQVLLGSGVPLTVGSCAVCKRHLCMTRGLARELWGGRGEIGAYLESILVDHLDKGGGIDPEPDPAKQKWPVWDSVTVAHLLGLSRFEERPRPSLTDDLRFEHNATPGTLRWITEIDSAALWARFADAVARAERTH